MKNPFRKKPDVTLSADTANQMLSNIFEACDQEANQVSIDVLQSYSHYRKEKHILQKIIIILLLLLFLMLPILFITAKVDISWVENTPPGSPVVQVVTKSIIPVDKITASMGPYNLEVYQVADGTYHIYPDRNGVLQITVFLSNHQFTEYNFSITNVDVTAPELVSSELVNGELVIYFRDDSGNLDYSSIYGIDGNGDTVYPIAMDMAKMCVTFAYPPKSFLNIFVSDTCENTLQLVLTVG